MGGHSGGGGRAGRSGGGGLSEPFDTLHPPIVNDGDEWRINNYANTMHAHVNHYLNTGEVLRKYDYDESRVKAEIAALDRTMAQNVLPKSATLYRGISETHAEKLADLTPGTIIKHKSFMSTSDNLQSVDKFVKYNEPKTIMKINAPRGTKAISMKRHTTLPEEREILVNRGYNLKYKGQTINGKTVIKEFDIVG